MAVGGTARLESAAPAARSRPRPKPRLAAEQRRIAGGVVVIAVLGILLAGVVALNVAVLRLNLRLEEVDGERAKLRAENAALASKLSSAAASPRIQALARQLGLVPADPEQTVYIRLRGRR